MKTFITKLRHSSNKGFTAAVCLAPIIALAAVVFWHTMPETSQRAGLCDDQRADQLMFSVGQGDLREVRRVLAAGVDVNRGTDLGLTSLMCAAYGPNEAAAET